ncbi:hypothetical protein BDQ17DRAFT_1352257 [Cyathus striatus]|nr:hypothetical protein BDQ17DRAFT_1352257 [Cyathus striatus]
MSTPPSIRVVVKLPWNRPENAPLDPPQIEWTPEKADILWKVIERSRSTESEGADWKGLAAHLEVPLPYILYRVHARFQDELRGLQDIQGALNPSTGQLPTAKSPDESSNNRPTVITGHSASTLTSRLSLSSRLSTPVNVRARLNSLNYNSPRPKKETSSSTLTVQGARKQYIPLQPTSQSSSEEESDTEEEADKEEEAERNAQEQEALDRKLQQLQEMMTNEALGLVSSSRPKGKGKVHDRLGMSSPRSMTGSYRRDGYSSQSLISSAGSPQGSIPEIPSSSPGSQPHSSPRRHISPIKSSSSPPTVSPRSTLSHAHTQSGHGSETSSFSDLSDASLSSLGSALMSNTRGASSRLPHFRTRLAGGRGVTKP